MGPRIVDEGELADALSDLDSHIPRSVKIKMIDLVLAWGRVDTTIAQLAGEAFAMDPTTAAVIFSKMRVSDRLAKIRELNLLRGRTDQAKVLRTLKKQYEDHSKPRNTIAHSACVGFLRNPDRLVFLPFEAQGTYGRLAVEAIPTEVIVRATRWAKRLDKQVCAMLQERWAADDSVDGEGEAPKGE